MSEKNQPLFFIKLSIFILKIIKRGFNSLLFFQRNVVIGKQKQGFAKKNGGYPGM
jgi:hypothetical protein